MAKILLGEIYPECYNGDKNSLPLGLRIGDSRLVSQGKTRHIMLGTGFGDGQVGCREEMSCDWGKGVTSNPIEDNGGKVYYSIRQSRVNLLGVRSKTLPWTAPQRTVDTAKGPRRHVYYTEHLP